MSSKGKLKAGYLELGFRCEYCGNPRSQCRNDKCSKARQLEHARRNDNANS